MFNLSWLLGKYSFHIQAEFIDDYLYIQDTLGVVFVRRASIFLTVAFFLMVAAVYDEWDTGFLYIACFILFCFVLSVLSLFYVKELKLHKNYVQRTSSFIFWSKTHETELAGNQKLLIFVVIPSGSTSSRRSVTNFRLQLNTRAPNFEEYLIPSTDYFVNFSMEKPRIIRDFFLRCKALAEFFDISIEISQQLLDYNQAVEIIEEVFGSEVVYAEYS